MNIADELRKLADQIEAQLEAEPESGPKKGEVVLFLGADGRIDPSIFCPGNDFHQRALAAGNLFWGPKAEECARHVAKRRRDHEAKCPPPFKEGQEVWCVTGSLDCVQRFTWESGSAFRQAEYANRLLFATKEEAEARRLELKEGK